MRTVIFMVGMHHSGVAALAAAFARCGVARLPVPGDPNAPTPIAALNRSLMAMAGARWDHLPATRDFATFAPRPIGEWARDALPAACAAWDATWSAAGNAQEGTAPDTASSPPADAASGTPPDVVSGTSPDAAGGAIPDAVFGAASPVLCHDRHLAVMLPLWLAVAEAKGIRAEVLLVRRDPVALIGALERQAGLGFGAAAALIVDTWLEMIAHAPSVSASEAPAAARRAEQRQRQRQRPHRRQ